MGTAQAGGSWLHNLFIRRQRLERELDGIFDDAPWPSGTKIICYNEVDAGLGDVAFMTKLLHLLAEPGGPELVLVSTGLEKQRRFPLPERVTVLAAEDAKGHPALTGCDLLLSAPGIFDHCRRGDDVRRTLGLPRETPFLYLAEYGSIRQLRDDAFKAHLAEMEAARDRYIDRVAETLGHDPDDCGFRGRTGEIVAVREDGPEVIGHLEQLFFDPDGDHPLRSFMRQPTLEARSCGLEEGELGVHIDVELALEAERIAAEPGLRRVLATALEHQGTRHRVLEALASGCALYQGYAHSGHKVFHDLVSTVEAHRGRSVLVVSPDRRDVETVFSDDFDDALLERLEARGFGAVRVVSERAGEGETGACEKRWGDGPAYTVSASFPIPFRDMRRLLLVAEPWTMVSGDQSFSDAISTGKAIGVIEPVYCQTFHLDATVALARDLDPDYAALLEAGLQYGWSPDRVAKAFETRTPSELEASGREVAARIQSRHNLNPVVKAVVRRALWTLAGDGAWLLPAVDAGLAALRRGESTGTAELQKLVRRPWVPVESGGT